MASIVPGSILSLLGGLIVVFTTRAIRRANSTRLWPAVTGTVIASYTDSHHNDKGTEMFRPVVQYSYTVRGTEYRSDKISPSGVVSTSWRKPADRLVAEYPAGQPCRVLHDPENPEESYLKPGAGVHYYVIVGIGYLLAAVGAGLLLF
jgi:hypothetical protein